jgi:predicted nucleic acid-binding protein
MIVVADASPLNYLIQLECIEILEQLYGRVLVPQVAMRELHD